MKLSVLEKNLDRFDFYISGANIKIGFILSFNSALTYAAVRYNLNDKIGAFSYLIMGVLTISTGFALAAVKPYLKSFKKTDSVYFFADIAKMKNKEYINHINDLDEEKQIKDLSTQTKSLANGLNAKMNLINISIILIIIALAGLVVFSILFLICPEYLVESSTAFNSLHSHT